MEENKDRYDGYRSVNQQNPRCPLLAFKLSAVFDEVTRRQIGLLRYFLLRLGNDASQITTSNVGLDYNPSLDPLPVNEIGPVFKDHLCYLTERDLDAIMSVH